MNNSKIRGNNNTVIQSKEQWRFIMPDKNRKSNNNNSKKKSKDAKDNDG